ncbi:hypothetical protein ACFUGD_01305 [Streptomyces sp. NPDC057217]|uniref:hypothetical protein n=1 Tax=Streptomyces sp. NPDC057217 TaxID=3346054 RepID=UPI0036332FC1
MSKPRTVSGLEKARRALRRSGATETQVREHEAELLRDVLQAAGIGSIPTDYVVDRIAELEAL